MIYIYIPMTKFGPPTTQSMAFSYQSRGQLGSRYIPGTPKNQKEMDVSPIPAISVKDFKLAPGTTRLVSGWD